MQCQSIIQQGHVFNLMAQIDLALQQLLPRCILLIGQTKVGKSTVFNWLANKKMIGKKIEGKPFYELPLESQEAAASIEHTDCSTTLIPNVHQVQEDTCLIDLPALRANRNQGVISLNYSAKIIFEKAKHLSFVFVLTFDQINSRGYEVLETLSRFTKLFDYEILRQRYQQTIFSSMALIITNMDQSIKLSQVISQLEKLIKTISQGRYRFESKQRYIQILSQIVKAERIELMRSASIGQITTKQQVLNSFCLKKWSFFDCASQRDRQLQFSTTNFFKNVGQLEESDQSQYYQQVRSKIQIQNNAVNIIKKIIDTSIIMIVCQENNYISCFEAIAKFIKENDHYERSHKLLKQKYKETNMRILPKIKKALSINQKIKKILKITTYLQNLGIQRKDQQFLSKYKDTRKYLRAALIEMRQLCCKNQQESLLFFDFSYILLRRISELEALHSMTGQLRNGPFYDWDIQYCFHSFKNSVAQIKQQIRQKLRTSDNNNANAYLKGQEDYRLYLKMFVDDSGDKITKQKGSLKQLYLEYLKEKLIFCQLSIRQRYLHNHQHYEQFIKISCTVMIDILDMVQSDLSQRQRRNQSSQVKQLMEEIFFRSLEVLASILWERKEWEKLQNFIKIMEYAPYNLNRENNIRFFSIIDQLIQNSNMVLQGSKLDCPCQKINNHVQNNQFIYDIDQENQAYANFSLDLEEVGHASRIQQVSQLQQLKLKIERLSSELSLNKQKYELLHQSYLQLEQSNSKLQILKIIISQNIKDHFIQAQTLHQNLMNILPSSKFSLETSMQELISNINRSALNHISTILLPFKQDIFDEIKRMKKKADKLAELKETTLSELSSKIFIEKGIPFVQAKQVETYINLLDNELKIIQIRIGELSVARQTLKSFINADYNGELKRQKCFTCNKPLGC